MPKFSYTVINNQNQQLSGTINAPNIKNAKDELNHLGLSVISIEEVDKESLEPQKENEASFEFEAFDTTGRRILGRIKEADKQAAYNRLRSEYNFDIVSIYPSHLSEEEKQIQKLEDTKELAAGFQSETTPIDAETQLDNDFNKKQADLQEKVKFVLHKVDEFLTKFQNEIKPDQKKEIDEKVGKIKLLKHSTNLEHLEKLCEELLIKIQEEKIFLHRDQFLKEKTEVAIEAKKMISDLHKKPKPSIQIFKTTNKDGSAHTNFFTKAFNELFKQNPEIVELKEQIRATNTNLIEYVKLYFKASSQNEKEEIKKRLQNLYNQRKNLKHQLHELKQAQAQQLLTNPDQDKLLILNNKLYHLSSWLLGFYLIYYFIGIHLTNKQFLFESPPAGFAIYDTVVFKYLLPILFSLHIFFSIKKLFLPKNLILNILGPISILTFSLIIIFNF